MPKSETDIYILLYINSAQIKGYFHNKNEVMQYQ